MPLEYAVIVRQNRSSNSGQNVVLARHTQRVGNFAEVTDEILSKIDKNKIKGSLQWNSNLFHYLIVDYQLIFLCITDDSFKPTSAFGFLAAISTKFEIQFGSKSANTAMPLAMQAEFGPILASEMKRFNLAEDQNKLMPYGAEGGDQDAGAGPSDDKLVRVRNEVDQTMTLMRNNVDGLLERGERLDNLIDKTDNLANHSVTFRQSATTLRRKMWWENKKMILIIALVIIVMLYIIVSISCGGLDWPKCVAKN